MTIIERFTKNIAGGCKKPLCYTLGAEQREGFIYTDTLVFWTRKGARDAARELKKLTGTRFVVAECWLREKKVAK